VLKDLADWVEPGGQGYQEFGGLVAVVDQHLLAPVHPRGEEAKRVIVRYGFGYEVSRWTHEEFMSDLWIVCMSDVYEFAREYEDDRPGRCTIMNSKPPGDVVLPEYYWRRRPGWTRASKRKRWASTGNSLSPLKDARADLRSPARDVMGKQHKRTTDNTWRTIDSCDAHYLGELIEVADEEDRAARARGRGYRQHPRVAGLERGLGRDATPRPVVSTPW
jgi:hypothetical protein